MHKCGTITCICKNLWACVTFDLCLFPSNSFWDFINSRSILISMFMFVCIHDTIWLWGCCLTDTQSDLDMIDSISWYFRTANIHVQEIYVNFMIFLRIVEFSCAWIFSKTLRRGGVYLFQVIWFFNQGLVLKPRWSSIWKFSKISCT